MSDEFAPRFVRVGDSGFDMEKVTSFIREGTKVTVYFGPDDYLIFSGNNALVVWEYLGKISQDMQEVKQ